MPDASGGARGWVRRHERLLTVAYLGLVGALALLVALPPTRARLLARIQATVDWWDDRWARRLARGEALLAEGRAEEAVAYFERLDRIHPATNQRHARDLERERVLRRLARSLEETGRRRRVVETYQRLVDFDSLNYHNHYALGSAAGRLLSGWALAPEARDAYQSVLEILPFHLPAARGTIDYYMDRGEYIPVTETYRAYLDAYFVHRVELRLGSASRWLALSGDGLPHEHLVTLTEPATAERLEIRTLGLSIRLDSLELLGAPRVGAAAAPSATGLDPRAAVLSGMEWTDEGALRALAESASLSLPVPRAAGAVRAVRLRVTLFKPLDAALWASVAKSYDNLLDGPGRADAERRTLALASAAAADSALFRLIWLHGNLGLTLDELSR
ncbi:MAG: tetratricopeptide repeat protein [Gemmatimonadales bacterium]